jgi:NAD(P)H-dependent FMN reductase
MKYAGFCDMVPEIVAPRCDSDRSSKEIHHASETIPLPPGKHRRVLGERGRMAKLIGLSGSLRKASFNSALLRAAAGLVPAGSELAIGTIRGIPLYDGDIEAADGIPAPAQALKDAVAAADGLLLVTPEYNNSIPGVFKNAIDWLSRPASDIKRVFGGKPVAIIGASPGGFGTILSQNAWLPVLHTLGAMHWSGGRLLVSRAEGVFDGAGALTDPRIVEQLRGFVGGFAAFADEMRDQRMS